MNYSVTTTELPIKVPSVKSKSCLLMLIHKELNYPILLISLDVDIERRAELKKRFVKYFPFFNIVSAVDGRLICAGEYYKKISEANEHKRIVTPGEVGCTLSHIKALEEYLSSNFENCLIIEDDVIGCDNDLLKIKNIIDKNKEADILICGGQEGLLTRKFICGDALDGDVYKVHPKSYKHLFRTCAYYLSRKAAEDILDFHKKNFGLVDNWKKIALSTQYAVFISPVLKHPEDLKLSHIELERKKSQSKIKKYDKYITRIYLAFNYVYWYIEKFYLRVQGKKVYYHD